MAATVMVVVVMVVVVVVVVRVGRNEGCVLAWPYSSCSFLVLSVAQTHYITARWILIAVSARRQGRSLPTKKEGRTKKSICQPAYRHGSPAFLSNFTVWIIYTPTCHWPTSGLMAVVVIMVYSTTMRKNTVNWEHGQEVGTSSTMSGLGWSRRWWRRK